ncbi:MAG TPA: hypothetical protein VFO26_10260 [Gaiella sp.]|uniref:hypothetical protein n=1 Tax=Gaiella sp. TaxID=2663207 RepID=UPI002D7F6D8E|nr:hypothetical protein [Gaiella sp.]HET9287932.1 hypothetical protein [Gaiella sp.]
MKTRITLVVIGAAVAIAALAGTAHAAAPRVVKMTGAQYAQVPHEPIKVASAISAAEAEAACLNMGGTWTVKMENGTKVATCTYKTCKVHPTRPLLRIMSWTIVAATCLDESFTWKNGRIE